MATASEAEDAIAALLERIFCQPPAIQTDARTGATSVGVYVGQRSDCPASKIVELREGLNRIRVCGLDPGPGKISLRKIRRENWAHSWKRHFKPLDISAALLIKPPWSKRRPRKNQAVVVLNPGLSFGTGQHPTTRFCLEQLVQWQGKPGQSCLDIGTGSGILAIAAAKLGYRPVEAFDSDPEAIRIARVNARRNKADIRFSCRDLTSLSPLPNKRPRRYDVVCANLTYDVLLAGKRRIMDSLKTPGVLIIAGLLRDQFAAIRQEYEQSGLKFIRSKTEKEWKSGVFLKAQRSNR